MLTSSAAAIAALVRPGGQMIVSGFDRTEIDAVLRGFSGFTETARLTEDNWIALLLRAQH